jgi:hypothetical protein
MLQGAGSDKGLGNSSLDFVIRDGEECCAKRNCCYEYLYIDIHRRTDVMS